MQEEKKWIKWYVCVNYMFCVYELVCLVICVVILMGHCVGGSRNFRFGVACLSST